MGTKADYPEKRKERIEQEFTDEMLATQAQRQGISIDEMRARIKDNPVWAARLEMAGSLERRRKFQSLYKKIHRFLRNHPEFLAYQLRTTVAGCFDAIAQVIGQRGSESSEVSDYLERPLKMLEKGLAIAKELSEAEDTIATKKSEDKVLTLYETLLSRLQRAETEKDAEQKKKIAIAMDTVQPQAKRRMRALEPDYIISLTHRMRILRLQQEAAKLQEEILRQLSAKIRESIKELTEVIKEPEVTKEILAELSAVRTAIDYSSSTEAVEPPPNLADLRTGVKEEEARLENTAKYIEQCKIMILELKEIENAVIETLFPEFEISDIEWDVPVKIKESKIRGLAPGIIPKPGTTRMARGERMDRGRS
ncbi:MAG: hypothetical protein ABIH23_08715 [bacterium]